MLEQIQKIVEQYYEVFPEETGRHPLLQSQLSAGDELTSRKNFRGHITTSATVLNRSATRVLLIYHRFFDLWLPPGGHYEGDASLWESSTREVEEETGVAPIELHGWAKGCLVPVDIDSHPIPMNAEKSEPAHVHHDFRFLAIANEEVVLVPQFKEVEAVQWAPIRALRDSCDTRVRALHTKLSRLNLL